MMFGLQAAINMAVNVHLMPAKGMTLPFISYGGSSLISLALGMGFLIALTRRRPARRDGGPARAVAAHERAGRSSFSAPAAPADTSFRPRRSRGALKRLDARVALATDRRAGALAGSFPAEEVIEIASATPSGRSPLQMAKAALFLGFGFLQASRGATPARPAAVVGFGGYPTVPPVLAAATSCASRPSSTSRTASWAGRTASSPDASRPSPPASRR